MRRIFLPFLVALAVPLAAPPLARQQPAQTAAVPEARAVIARFLEVTKLGEKLEKSQSRHEKMNLAIGGMEAAGERWSARPATRKDAIDLGGLGGIVHTGVTGGAGWTSDPMRGPVLLEGVDLLQMRLEADWFSVLKPDSLYESVRTVGLEAFQGKGCWKVESVARPLPGMDPEATKAARTILEYYEVESGFLVAQNGTMDGELGTGPTSSVFSDYKDFGGIQLPAKTTLRQAGIECVLTLVSVEFDTVAEEDLAPPADVKKLIEAAGTKSEPKPQ